ncbi:MAG: CpaF family protein [Chloroflexi bacterium]|nr:CpaF family protein [Chloroflexota bacterium]
MSELPAEFRDRPPVSAKTLGSIRSRLVARLAPEVLNPFDRTPEREATLKAAIGDILADPELALAATPALVASVEAAVCGLGPLQPLVDDPRVSDILVNAPDAVFAERAGRLEETAVALGSAEALVDIAPRIAALAGRELSVAHPIVDARMPDGSRVNAVIPPVGGPYLAIRKFNRLRLDLAPGGRHGRDWVTEGGMSPEMADFLARMVRAKANILVAGETGAGKTTLLRSLTDLFDPAERVGVVEDTAELALENPDRFNLETIHPHDLATGEAESRLLDVGDLVANALRMRPDRLIVGEIRLPKEAFYTLQALHSGHDGSATTIHASSAEDALFRLELLARQSMRDLTVADLRTYIARVFDLILVLRRLRSGRRVLRQVAALDGIGTDAAYRIVDVFRSVRADGPDAVTWVTTDGWEPSDRLATRMELEA